MSLITENFNGSLMPAGWNYIDLDDGASSTTGHSGAAARITNSQGNYGGYISPDFAATTNVTVDVWFRGDNWMYGAGGPWLELRNGSTKMLGLRISGSGSIEVYQYSGPTSSMVTSGPSYLTTYVFYHMVLTADLTNGGNMSLTIDGASELSAVMGSWANGATGATNLVLGTAPYTYYDFDDLAVDAAGGGGGGSPPSRFQSGLLRGVCRGLF